MYYEHYFETSMDDFITSERHLAIWDVEPDDYWEPGYQSLVSVDGMGKNICPDDLWIAALDSFDIYQAQESCDYD